MSGFSVGDIVEVVQICKSASDREEGKKSALGQVFKIHRVRSHPNEFGDCFGLGDKKGCSFGWLFHPDELKHVERGDANQIAPGDYVRVFERNEPVRVTRLKVLVDTVDDSGAESFGLTVLQVFSKGENDAMNDARLEQEQKKMAAEYTQKLDNVKKLCDEMLSMRTKMDEMQALRTKTHNKESK